MLIERIYDHDLSQAAYLLGCQETGEALVVDGRRDVQAFTGLAAANGLRITAVTETHIHADYLSGTREIAEATGAQIYVSGEGGQGWQYGFDAQRLHHGDTFTVGTITVQALHTPGHTPEHLCFLVTDGSMTDQPGYLLSGDFVFVGDLGRPDLLDEVAAGDDTRFAGAQDLFASLRDVFLTLPDWVQVLPAHGAGSPCGKALGSIPSSTVGYERLFSWWAPYLRDGDEQGFVDELLSGQPDAHSYFSRMKRQNREGPAVMGRRPSLPELDPAQVAQSLVVGEVIVVDTRHNSLVHSGTAAGSLNIPAAKPAAYGAWVYDPERESRPVVLLADTSEQAEELRDHLVRVGIDEFAGYITTFDGLPLVEPETVAPSELAATDYELLLDVRGKSEFAGGHIPGATQLNAGRVMWHLDELPQDGGTIVSYCQSGVRNSVAASALRAAGYRVLELEGSYNGWSDWNSTRGAAAEEPATA
ncbi:MBL fold metallo-hydrolase [Brevibacterium daeguense]|uniref:MBL fold metallo-hydrolase n=1 Tax=Brevibacterium daeguense TaxID=909936 RepID=A0ABP8EJY0_9MICO|nr:MBL fold metallo-hydrolase [Brevibacterium daeguense]